MRESARLAKLRRVLAEQDLPAEQAAQLDQLRAATHAELQRLRIDRRGRAFQESWALAADVLTASLIGLGLSDEHVARTLVVFASMALDPEPGREREGP